MVIFDREKINCRSMSYSIYQILFLTTLLVLSGCSKANYRMPTREVERPLNNPEGMKSIVPHFSTVWSFSPSESEETYKYLFIPTMSYAVSHNFQLAALPFPYFQYQPVSKIGYDGEKFWLNGFNLAVTGGLSPASFFHDTSGFTPVSDLGILYKHPFNYYTWNEGGWISSLTNMENLLTRVGTKFGAQLSDYFSIKLGYTFIVDQPLKHPGIRYFHNLPLTVNISPRPYFSVWLSFGPIAEQHKYNRYSSSVSVDLHW